MVRVAGITEVDDGGVVEQRSIRFGDSLQLPGQIGQQLHVMKANDVACFLTGFSVADFLVSNSVDASFGQTEVVVGCTDIVQSESHDVGDSRDQRGGCQVDVCLLANRRSFRGESIGKIRRGFTDTI